jgi:CubicO group peptidase (beta-lactamase class C family)
MAYKTFSSCRKYIATAATLLYLQVATAQRDFDPVNKWLSENVNDLGGRAVIVVLKDGKIVYNQAENDLSRRQKMIGKFIAKRKGIDPDEALKDFNSTSKQMIASCSKWLSAALVMTFVDEGKLNVNDTIGKFLPVMNENGKGSITIWQCLSHLTGIKSGSLKESLEEFKHIQTMDQAMEEIAHQPMEGEPGKTFHYSSIGLQIAGAIIEKISGKDFETLFAERIAKPLEMTQSDFGHNRVALPAGSARSTAEDYLKFLSMILNEGMYKGKRILSKQSIIEMQVNRVSKDTKIAYTPAEAGLWGYGFGEWVMDDASAGKRSRAVTSPGLFGSFPWVDYDHNYAAFLFTFNLKSKGRGERYHELKNIIDGIITKN